MKVFPLLLVLLFSVTSVNAALIKIGVRAHSGVTKGLQQWHQTADYLTEKIPEHEFIIVPVVSIDDLITSVSRGDFDFVLTNPSMSVELEKRSGTTALVTLINDRRGQPFTRYGSVIFTRSNRDDINSIIELKGKSIIAVSPKAFGGWLIAFREMIQEGIKEKDFYPLAFSGGIQEDVVLAVLNREYDAGVVRTDMLEGMAADKLIDLKEIKVIHQKKTNGFPLFHSSELYPEWPFSKHKDTDNALAQKVALALLTMPQHHTAAKAGGYIGWTVVEDYQPVRDLLKELKIGPYRDEGKININHLLDTYPWWILSVLILIIFLLICLAYIVRFSLKLKEEKNKQIEVNRKIQQKIIELNCLYQISSIVDEDNTIDQVFEKVVHVLESYLNKAEKISIRLVFKHDEFLSKSFEYSDYKLTSEFRENNQLVGLIQVYHNGLSSFTNKHEIKELAALLAEVATRLSHYLDVREARIKLTKMNSELEQRVDERTKELTKAKDIAESANSSKTEFMTKMSHEIRTPLNSIVGFCQLLSINKELTENKKISSQLKEIKHSSDHILSLVDDVLDLAKIESGGIEVDYEEINVKNLIKNTVSMLQPMLNEKEIGFNIEVEENAETLTSDRRILKQVLLNLSSNAIKYNTIKGSVDIKVSQTDMGDILFSVNDTGVGIAPDKKELLFHEFGRVGKELALGGAGMGLVIAKKSIEMLDGKIGVESIEGKGTSFWFRIPNAY